MLFLHAQQTIDSQLPWTVFHDEAIGIEHDDSSCDIDHEEPQAESEQYGRAPSKLGNAGIKGQGVKEVSDGHCENDRNRKGIIELAVLDQIGAS